MTTKNQTAARLLGGRRQLLLVAILAACACLTAGISQPIVELRQLNYFTTEHSLVETVWLLFRDQQYFLGGVILVFSILLPFFKLIYLVLLSVLPQANIIRYSRYLKTLEWLGKFSMHDVLVLALTIFFIRQASVYTASSGTGVYFFTAAVVIIMLSYSFLHAETQRTLDSNRRAHPAMSRSIVLTSAFSVFLIGATACFILGLTLPVISFTTAYVWTSDHSILSIIEALYQSGEVFLCLILLITSVVFPFLKLFYLNVLAIRPELLHGRRSRRYISAMEFLGRYSMTDVMVLALMIFYMNSSGYTEATVLPGAYFFAGATLMTMLAYAWANTFSQPTAAQAGRA
ncbi:MAG: paraquat-inducible protein A [Pseudomonadota bacterium]